MRKITVLLLVFVSLMGCRSVIAAEPALSDAQAWVGKYPFDKIDGKKLWEHDAFVAEANKILGDEAANIFFKTMITGPNVPVERNGDIVFTFVCKAHECNSNFVNVFIDVKKNKLHMCWHENGVVEDAWVSSGVKPKWLGEMGCSGKDGIELYKANVKE